MLFIDLKKLKIEKEFRYEQFAIEVPVDITNAAAKIKAQAKEACKKLFKDKPAIAAQYHIEILPRQKVTEDDFISLVNIFVIAFFENLITTGGRPRERRLDVPEQLSCAHISMGLLKRAINTKTVTDVFNLTINCKHYCYMLIDTKETKENE